MSDVFTACWVNDQSVPVEASVMSARRILAALAGTTFVVLVTSLGIGAGAAGAATPPAPLHGQSVLTPAGMLPAQPPPPADDGDRVLGKLLYLTGFALVLGGTAVAVHGSAIAPFAKGRRRVGDLGQVSLAQRQLLAPFAASSGSNR